MGTHAGPAVEVDTRGRLIEAAGRLFADQGFRRVTIREICRAAGANVAAVNYHFGGKLGIYREVVETVIAKLRWVTEESIRAGAGRPADERLREYVRVFVEAVSESGPTWVRGLMFREMSDPTPALAELADRGLKPRLDYLATIMADLLQAPPSDPRVLMCTGSVQSQLVMAVWNPVAQRLYPGPAPTPRDVDALIAHITRFSLGGIGRVAGTQESREPRGPREPREPRVPDL